MFTLLYGFWKYLFRKDEFFVLILGLDNAGKTTLLERTKATFDSTYKAMNPAKVTSTVGLNIGKIDTDGLRLNFWDLGGQEELRSLWDKYYAECHGALYVIDSSDRERLKESWTAFDSMLDSDAFEGVPLLIVCNKQDLEDSLSIPEIKTVFHDSVEKLGRRDCTVLPVSGLTGLNVEEGIKWLVECIQRNLRNRPPKEHV